MRTKLFIAGLLACLTVPAGAAPAPMPWPASPYIRNTFDRSVSAGAARTALGITDTNGSFLTVAPDVNTNRLSTNDAVLDLAGNAADWSDLGTNGARFVDANGNWTGGLEGSNSTTSVGGTFIGGGTANVIGTNMPASAIVGGSGNTVPDSALVGSGWNFIGGGSANRIATTEWAGIVGGAYNESVGSTGPFIGGGYSNLVVGLQSSIVGGKSNYLGGNYSVIEGGRYNWVHADNSSVGGSYNVLGTSIFTSESGIVLGSSNRVEASVAGAIGWGLTNTVTKTLDLGVSDATKMTLSATGVVSKVPFYGSGAGLTDLPLSDLPVTNNDSRAISLTNAENVFAGTLQSGTISEGTFDTTNTTGWKWDTYTVTNRPTNLWATPNLPLASDVEHGMTSRLLETNDFSANAYTTFTTGSAGTASNVTAPTITGDVLASEDGATYTNLHLGVWRATVTTTDDVPVTVRSWSLPTNNSLGVRGFMMAQGSYSNVTLREISALFENRATVALIDSTNKTLLPQVDSTTNWLTYFTNDDTTVWLTAVGQVDQSIFWGFQGDMMQLTNGTVAASCSPAAIAGQPAAYENVTNSTATFTVTPSGSSPFTYVWQQTNYVDGFTNIYLPGKFAGTNGATLSVFATLEVDGGYFRCAVANACGSITSSPALMTITNGVAPPEGGYTFTNGMVAEWKFNEGLGTNAVETWANNGWVPQAKWTPGVSNVQYGIGGDHTNIIMTSSNAISFATSNVLTLAFWIYPTNWSATQNQILLESSTNYNNNTGSFIVYHRNGYQLLHAFVNVAGGDSVGGQFAFADALSGQWNHVVITLDNSGATATPLSAWVNGVAVTPEQTNPTHTNGIAFATQKIYLGNVRGTDEAVNAAFDHLQLFNTTLVETNVVNLMTNTAAW